MNHSITPRQLALELLNQVTINQAYSNLTLPKLLSNAKLSPEDTRLATELSYGSLRMLGSLDPVIAVNSSRSLAKTDPVVLNILRLGSYQLLFTRVPNHAAVDESVKLTRKAQLASASGYVNAVLRKVSSKSFHNWVDQLEPIASDARLSLQYGHPEWVIRAFRDRLAKLVAPELVEPELSALLTADNQAPIVDLVILPNSSPTTRAEFAEDVTACAYAPNGYHLRFGLPGRFPAIRTGKARVQDQGSQLAAHALIAAKPVNAKESWADFCAGPGGKAALLAGYAQKYQADFLANEVNPNRTNLVRQALAAVNADAIVQTGDARDFKTQQQKFDRIMLDAPCSGLGALRRRPEARWRKQPADLAELTKLQEELLLSALLSLKPGGIVCYVTCSPHPAETVKIVNRVLDRNPGYQKLDSKAALDGITVAPLPESVSNQLQVQLWPHHTGTDAMFISLIQKQVS